MTSREPVENKGSKRRNNYALECGPEWTSWICNNWTAGVTAVAVSLLRLLLLLCIGTILLCICHGTSCLSGFIS